MFYGLQTLNTMKKIILLFAIAVSASAVQAQTASGTFFAGGSLGFNSSSNKIKVGSNSTDDWKESLITFNPTIGYFVADKTAVGIVATFTNRKRTEFFANNDKTVTTETPINVGVFGRRYFMLNDQFGFTGTLGVYGILGGSEEEDYDASSNTTTVDKFNNRGFGAAITAGPVWFATPHIGLEANVGLIGFRSETITQENTNPEVSMTESGFNFGLSTMSLNFGFHYYFF